MRTYRVKMKTHIIPTVPNMSGNLAIPIDSVFFHKNSWLSEDIFDTCVSLLMIV